MTESAVATPVQTVEVRFKGNRRAFHDWKDFEAPLYLNEPVIVQVERGLDFGRISKVGDAAARTCAAHCSGCAVGGAPAEAVHPVMRRATTQDIRTANDLRRSEEEVRRKTIERVRSHTLPMKISDAEWQWDRAKLTVYFTAEKRIDFRALVRDLAGLFRTRIELRQIGVRDEAARLTGVGRCGREYCCSTWLTELSPVSLALAKDQHLSLNPSQISGGCGRLLCCLKYEHEFYVAQRKRFPREGKLLKTVVGDERVVAVDIFRERVFLRHEERGSRIIPLVQLAEELESLGFQLPTPANRPAVAPPVEATTAIPDPERAPPPDAGATRPRRRRRRRGRRGGGGGGNDNGGGENPSDPSSSEPTPPIES
jgi:cell fate regulator YaaT (PSP1 superfamily)